MRRKVGMTSSPHGLYAQGYTRTTMGYRDWETEKEVQRYITKIDPVTKGPVTFLGKPLAGGINLMMLLSYRD